MTEKELSNLSTDVLFDKLMQSTKELISLVHKENIAAFEAKKAEVQLLQKIILAKKQIESPAD